MYFIGSEECFCLRHQLSSNCRFIVMTMDEINSGSTKIGQKEPFRPNTQKSIVILKILFQNLCMHFQKKCSKWCWFREEGEGSGPVGGGLDGSGPVQNGAVARVGEVPEGWGPKGGSTEVWEGRTQKMWKPKGGGPKGGARRVMRPIGEGARMVGGPQFRAFFFLLPPPCSLFCFSGRLLVEFWWCLKCWGPQMCTFWSSLGTNKQTKPPHTDLREMASATKFVIAPPKPIFQIFIKNLMLLK